MNTLKQIALELLEKYRMERVGRRNHRIQKENRGGLRVEVILNKNYKNSIYENVYFSDTTKQMVLSRDIREALSVAEYEKLSQGTLYFYGADDNTFVQVGHGDSHYNYYNKITTPEQKSATPLLRVKITTKDLGERVTRKEIYRHGEEHNIPDIERTDPLFIKLIKEGCTKFNIVDIPDNTHYQVEYSGGVYAIHEKHIVWWVK